MSHPETRVRTPARRAFEHLRSEFATEFIRRNPSGGLPLKVRKGGTSPIRYRAASGTFSADLGPSGAEGLPDLTRYPEALATGRELLELCTERFDAYSRYLGRGGASAGETLQALALLPPSQRRSASREAAGDSLAWLTARADAGTPVPFQDVCARVGGQPRKRPRRQGSATLRTRSAASGWGSSQTRASPGAPPPRRPCCSSLWTPRAILSARHRTPIRRRS